MSVDADPVIAAGAVVWRPSAAGFEVCLVHRPRHDDWSLPKGKVDPGEHVLACAAREVAEETGLDVALGRPLPAREYVTDGRRKRVYYWLAEVRHDNGPRPVDDEVDEVVFLPLSEALARLTYLRDVELLGEAFSEPPWTTPLALLRHAKAVSRSAWSAPDRRRPLDGVGERDALVLAPALAALGLRRLVTSDARRCVQSVRPLAALLGLPMELEPALSEDGLHDQTRSPRDVVDALIAAQTPALVCSHRPVLPLLFEAAGTSAPNLPPGAFVVLHLRDGQIVAADRHDPLFLASSPVTEP